MAGSLATGTSSKPFRGLGNTVSESFLTSTVYLVRPIISLRHLVGDDGTREPCSPFAGSQNGWNHSGRGIGIVNWMYGVMGITNAQRSLEILRTMVEYISQDGIKQVVPVYVRRTSLYPLTRDGVD